MKLTEAQIKTLRMVEKRNWPAGEPRLGWLRKATARKLLALQLIAERPSSATAGKYFAGSIVDLTEAGRAALSAAREE